MTANSHPADQPYADRSADELLAFVKLRDRLSVADASEVRNTKFSGQFGGLYVRALQTRYDIDSESTALDDGDNCIIDADGNHFLKVTEGADLVSRIYTDADISTGAIAIENTTDRALINITAAAVALTIPAAADRAGRDLFIKDVGGTAAAGTAITPAFNGAETCDALSGSSFAITTPYGFLQIAPKTGGYYAVANQL